MHKQTTNIRSSMQTSLDVPKQDKTQVESSINKSIENDNVDKLYNSGKTPEMAYS